MPTLVIIDAREQLGVSRCGLVAPRAYYDLHHGLGKRVISNVVHVIRVATGEISESLTDEGTSKAAVELGRKGGLARAKKIPKARRAAIARKAALHKRH